MDYIESIEVIKKDNKDLEIKQINFRKHLSKNMQTYLMLKQLIVINIFLLTVIIFK